MRGLHLGHEFIHFAVGTGGSEQLRLPGQSGLELVSEVEPLAAGTGAQVAERADYFLAGPLRSEHAFDEQVIEVGLALVSPRSLADVHICRHYDARRHLSAMAKEAEKSEFKPHLGS